MEQRVAPPAADFNLSRRALKDDNSRENRTKNNSNREDSEKESNQKTKRETRLKEAKSEVDRILSGTTESTRRVLFPEVYKSGTSYPTILISPGPVSRKPGLSSLSMISIHPSWLATCRQSNYETHVSLGYIADPAIGDNWRRALDSTNIRMDFAYPDKAFEFLLLKTR